MKDHTSIPTFIFDENRGWLHVTQGNLKVWFKGYVYGGVTITNVIKNCMELADRGDADWLDNYVSCFHGHYAVVVSSPAFAYAAVDAVRSVPLFVFTDGDIIRIGDHAPTVLPEVLQTPENTNAESILEIEMAGYTLSENGVYSGLRSLFPDQRITIYPNNKEDLRRSYTYAPWQSSEAINEPHAQLASITKAIFSDLVDELNGRQVVVPLSAGNDSRLVVAMLKYLGYENVLCFSYGMKDNYEARVAKRIARNLGYRWEFVELSLRREREFYASDDYRGYLEFADTFEAVPYVQGLSTIRELKKRNSVDSNSVWINGNSGDFISGSHLPHCQPVGPSIQAWWAVEEHYLNKHFSLWRRLRTYDNDAQIRNRLENESDALKENFCAGPAQAFEYLEFLHRQSKYVIQGQRTYEYYGFEWRMPLWDQRYLAFWSKVPVRLKVDQRLYRETLRSFNFGGAWGKDMPVNNKDVRPRSVAAARAASKVPFALFGPAGRRAWKGFDRCVYYYFYDVTRMMCSVPYFEVLRQCSKGPRHHVSFQAHQYLVEKGLDSHVQL